MHGRARHQACVVAVGVPHQFQATSPRVLDMLQHGWIVQQHGVDHEAGQRGGAGLQQFSQQARRRRTQCQCGGFAAPELTDGVQQGFNGQRVPGGRVQRQQHTGYLALCVPQQLVAQHHIVQHASGHGISL